MLSIPRRRTAPTSAPIVREDSRSRPILMLILTTYTAYRSRDLGLAMSSTSLDPQTLYLSQKKRRPVSSTIRLMDASVVETSTLMPMSIFPGYSSRNTMCIMTILKALLRSKNVKCTSTLDVYPANYQDRESCKLWLER